jgi:hypothetical protein
MSNAALAGQITVWAIIIGVPAWQFYKWATKYDAPRTVENEQDATREVVAASPQWQNITTQNELPDYHDLDDVPQDLILRHIRDVA